MALPKQTAAATVKPSIELPDQQEICRVEVIGGKVYCVFEIAPELMPRLKSRSGPIDLARYLWENILYRAIIGHIY